MPAPELNGALREEVVSDASIQGPSVVERQEGEAVPDANIINWECLRDNLPHLLTEMSRDPAPVEVYGEGFLQDQGLDLQRSLDETAASGSMSQRLAQAATAAANNLEATSNTRSSSPLTDGDVPQSVDLGPAPIAHHFTRAAARSDHHRAARAIKPHKGTHQSHSS